MSEALPRQTKIIEVKTNHGVQNKKKTLGQIAAEKSMTGVMGGLMGFGLGTSMAGLVCFYGGKISTLMMRLPREQRMPVFKANMWKSGGFMAVIFGIGSMFR